MDSTSCNSFAWMDTSLSTAAGMRGVGISFLSLTRRSREQIVSKWKRRGKRQQYGKDNQGHKHGVGLYHYALHIKRRGCFVLIDIVIPIYRSRKRGLKCLVRYMISIVFLPASLSSFGMVSRRTPSSYFAWTFSMSTGRGKRCSD